MNPFRSNFPLLVQNPDLVYLDSASTSQKPAEVINAVSEVYTTRNANVQRSLYDLGINATDSFEAVRRKTATFIGAASADEIIFTSGTTESANLVAEGWAKRNLKRGDIVVTSIMEHHSNFVPWLKLKKEIGIQLHILQFDQMYQLDYRIDKIDFSKVKLLALTHASNVIGTINPISDIVSYFKENGADDLYVFVDSAQSLPHVQIAVNDLQADFLAFSSHKMFGPSGTGVLYASRRTHQSFEPLKTGSHMIESVDCSHASWAQPPDRFEAGTPNIEGVIGFGAALDYITQVGWKQIQKHGQSITTYALNRLKAIPDVTLYGSADTADRIGIFAFNIAGVHAHDVAEIANRHHVCVRAGHHCAMPLMQQLGVSGSVRASTQLYTSHMDIDVLVEAIMDTKAVFSV